MPKLPANKALRESRLLAAPRNPAPCRTPSDHVVGRCSRGEPSGRLEALEEALESRYLFCIGIFGNAALGAHVTPGMMAIIERAAASADRRWDRRSPSRATVVPPCSLRGRSRHPVRAMLASLRVAVRGGPALSSPSLRATVHASRGRRDEGCLRRGLKVSGCQGENTFKHTGRNVLQTPHLACSAAVFSLHLASAKAESQPRPLRAIALSTVSSFLMQAVNATFFSLPAASSRS